MAERIHAFEAWEPLYQEILDDFGFSRERDEEAGGILFDILKSVPNSSEILAMASEHVGCQFVVICGNAPTLADEDGRAFYIPALNLTASSSQPTVLLRSPEDWYSSRYNCN